MSKKYAPLKYLQYNSCQHKIIVLNLNNADNICATENMSKWNTENIYLKRSYRDKIIMFNPKMQKMCRTTTMSPQELLL